MTRSGIIPALVALLLLGTLLATPAHAQSGDKKGEQQIPRIPREKIPPSPPLAPDDALKAFKLQPGFVVELVAAEPMVEVPIIAQFDPDGRLWVVEMRSFMPNADGRGETNATGRVSILEDTDGDGRMDRKKIFIDHLVLPRALLLVKGGVLVCEPPRLWFYPNQEDIAGDRVLVAEDFAREADPGLGERMNLEHAGSSLLRSTDNWIYSLYHSYRYRQQGGKWRREAMPRRAQWGLSQDDFGRLFYTSNSDLLRGDMVPSHYFSIPSARSLKAPGIGVQVARDQTVWPARINPGVNRGYQPDTLKPDGTLNKATAACGTCIYRGDLFPAGFPGNAFVCEPAGNLVRRFILSEQDGVVSARNAYDKQEFLASTDELFRPVNLTTGPDGALYVVDLYHGILQHRVYLTSYLRKQAEDRGLDRVTGGGRIWRVRPAGAPRVQRGSLSKLATADLVPLLSHPNGWHRDTAQRLLVDHADDAVVPQLQTLVTNAPSLLGRWHALWTLEGMDKLSPATVSVAMDDPQPRVRAAAIRQVEPLLQRGAGDQAIAGLKNKLTRLASDPNAEVQIQLALSLSLIPPDASTKAAFAALTRHPTGSLAREAMAFTAATLDPSRSAPQATNTARALTAEESRRFAAGKLMYEITCLACHQQNGLGQPGLAPPLAGSEWVAGPETRLIRIVLNGLRGPIRVKGETFELDMPALGILDDEQIASALTYVRREWGHPYEPVKPETVKKIREETASREDAWTSLDLLKIP